jgi:hypothetical protein
MDDFFLAMGQQGHLIGFVKMRRQDMS